MLRTAAGFYPHHARFFLLFDALVMPMFFLVLCGLLGPGALAGPNSDNGAPVLTESGREAEYKRLHEELSRLVKRNAWAGAERTYQAMLETGVEPHFQDLKLAAQVAQSFGDIQVVRDRLAAATKLREDPEILNALWAIDHNYGKVSLAGDPGKVELKVDVVPFDPTHARAVEHAVEQVAATGMFEGLLPRGSYTFAGRAVEVRPDASMQRIDLRSDGGVRKSNRARRKGK